MKISKMARGIETSLTRKLFNMAKNYNDVIDLTLGDPDIQPLDEIKTAACEAIKEGKTRYSANAGLIELREKICQCFRNEYNLYADPTEDIIVTVGGMEALFLTFACLIDDGDEVIIQAPYYVNYVQMIKMCGGVPIVIDTDERCDFQFTKAQLESKITDKTIAIVINSPGNPSGTVLESKLLDDIADIAIEKDLIVISDEVYRTLIYDNRVHDSIITRPAMQERTVLIDSISKRFAMTGYRIGFAIAPKPLIESMTKMQENVCACAPLPSQHAAIRAYSSCTRDNNLYKTFEERRNYLAEAINNIPGLHCKKPQGTFYLFVNIESTGMDCLKFSYKLLEEAHVAVVPAITYGDAYTSYIRIAFTLDIAKLTEAVSRIRHFMEQF